MIILIILTITILICVIIAATSDNTVTNYFAGQISGMGIILISLYFALPTHVTIEKSSDSDWIKSKTNYNDTTITTIKILNNKDTVYPTKYYKRIKIR